LDGHGRSIDSQRTGSLTRGGTDPAGELGEVVRGMKTIEGFPPVVVIDQIVPFGNEVVNRTAGSHPRDQVTRMAERNSAIHAARPLRLQDIEFDLLRELVPVLDPFERLQLGSSTTV